MKKTLTTIYAIFCTLLLTAGLLLVFCFAWQSGTADVIQSLLGMLLGFILAPTIHEIGHVVFASASKMNVVYVKCFCLKIYEKNGKKHLGLAMPFSPDETQVLPTQSDDMQKRAMGYALGGLIFGGAFLFCVVLAAILLTVFGHTQYILWGIAPYATYLFLLNVMPLEYASGKTDMLVCVGLKKGYDAEKNMLAAMEIQAHLAEGQSFAEMNPFLYFDVPQLCEEEPLFAVMLDLRYHYYLEKGDLEKAASNLNRLISIAEDLPDNIYEKIAAEAVYMHSVRGELAEAEAVAQECKDFLKEETATAKRVLAAWSKASGQKDFIPPLLMQGRACLETEKIAGVRKFEEILLSRISEE